MFSTADIVMSILLLLGALQGAVRGLTIELVRLTGGLAALAAGLYAYRPAGAVLAERTRLAGRAPFVLSFVLAVLAALILLWLLRLVFRGLMEFHFNGALERLGGALLGALRIAVLLVVVLLAVDLWGQPFFHQRLIETSAIGGLVRDRLTPFYEEIAARHPEWPLPLPSPRESEPGSDQASGIERAGAGASWQA